MNIIRDIATHEGFRAKPYQCTSGVWTFGHGLTYITEKESLDIVRIRVGELHGKLYHEIKHLNRARQEVIINMAYNLGINGVRNFKKMWVAIRQEDYETASKEMLESKWAKQVKGRAVELAEIMRTGTK